MPPPLVVVIYYYCKTKASAFDKQMRDCDNPYFRLDQVDRAIWTWLERFIFDEAELLKGLKDYQSAQGHNPLENELRLIKAELSNKEAEFKAAMADMKAANSPRAKAVFVQDLERVEAQLDALEMRRAELETKLKDKTLTDEQITDLMQFAAMLRVDWEVISQDYESRRELLARLNIEVQLFVDAERGQMKAKITGKVTAEEQTVSLENRSSLPPSKVPHSMTNMPLRGDCCRIAPGIFTMATSSPFDPNTSARMNCSKRTGRCGAKPSHRHTLPGGSLAAVAICGGGRC